MKSGTNQLHGTAYYFNHNEFFERQNAFSITKPASRNQHYGFSVGGPILILHPEPIPQYSVG
ncbi:hypothetical protein [Edaphobacter bradus]